MQFDQEHKVIISTLSTCEARAFVKFLESEIIRHRGDIINVKFLESEIIRHRGDIINAQEIINQVIIRFGEVK